MQQVLGVGIVTAGQNSHSPQLCLMFARVLCASYMKLQPELLLFLLLFACCYKHRIWLTRTSWLDLVAWRYVIIRD